MPSPKSSNEINQSLPEGGAPTDPIVGRREPLAVDDWRHSLGRDDEITWNDPDEGLCTRKGIIQSIVYGADDSASITWNDGTTTEVYLHEIS